MAQTNHLWSKHRVVHSILNTATDIVSGMMTALLASDLKVRNHMHALVKT